MDRERERRLLETPEVQQVLKLEALWQELMALERLKVAASREFAALLAQQGPSQEVPVEFAVDDPLTVPIRRQSTHR